MLCLLVDILFAHSISLILRQKMHNDECYIYTRVCISCARARVVKWQLFLSFVRVGKQSYHSVLTEGI